jgi:CRISPR-associated protein Cas1
MKQTVIVYSHFVEISRKSDRVCIETPKIKSELPLPNIDGILVFGKAKLTSEVISLCMKHNVPILLLTQYGTLKGLILPPPQSEATSKRIKQFTLYYFKKIEIARLIVQRKCDEVEATFHLELSKSKEALKKANDLNQILGVEGSISKAMFESFERLLSGTDFKFEERTYYPPKDEVNTLLSFVYTLGYNLALSLLLLKGFDPFISFLHVKRGSHASFASDLVEIIRPQLTLFCAKLLQDGTVSKGDFLKERGSYLLKKQAVSRVLERFNPLKEELLVPMKLFLSDLESFEV